MNAPEHLIRKLHPIEQAFTISNAVDPLVVVCALHLHHGPSVNGLTTALAQLQSRHRLLRAGIVASRRGLYFQHLSPTPPIPLAVIQRRHAAHWQSVGQEALNTSFAMSGPLMRCWYLQANGSEESELIICFHHAIIDGSSARLVLHEILSLCGMVSLPEPLAEEVTAQFPPEYRRPKLALRLPAFMARQMSNEWRYLQKGINNPIPADSHNALISLRLDVATTRKLNLSIGRRGLSLNSVLLAAITEALIRHRHAPDPARLARAICFVDLRSQLLPAVPEDQLGCYISMVRLDTSLTTGQDTWSLSHSIRRLIARTARSGETFLMSILSKYLVRMVLRLQNTRLGLSAISFIGPLRLQAEYGPIQLREVHAYITNNRFGPEFSAFGKLLFGCLGLDFTYLTSELSEAEAREMVADIKKTLEKMADMP